MVKIQPVLAVEEEVIQRNIAFAKSLNLPKVYFPPYPHNAKLAIVGGGPSIRDKFNELREFDSIIAINNTRNTLLNFGIDATFCSVDPLPVIADFAKGATKALLATRCAPEVFEALKGAHIKVFDAPGDCPLQSCTASTLFVLAAKMGFRKVCYFGCESSYRGTSHVDRHEEREVIKVLADGKEFITAGDYYIQAMELSEGIRLNPGVVSEKSGGLLRAMIRDPNHKPIEVGKLCLSV